MADIDIQGGPLNTTAIHLAAGTSLYRIAHVLIANEANLFLTNSDGKTPITAVGNNILMIKILKKAMNSFLKERFLTGVRLPTEDHLINANLLMSLSEKFIFGSRKRMLRSKKAFL